MDKLTAIIGVSLGLLAATAAIADPFRAQLDFGAGYSWAEADSIDAMIGFPEHAGGNAGLRLMWQGGEGPWRYEVHSLLQFEAGDTVAYKAALGGMFPSAPPASFFDLSSELYNDGQMSLTHTVDRLSLSYTNDKFVVRVGRQAVTWGTGMVFRPGDIIAPFAPNAVDTSYKPGADMVYGQYLLDSGADIEAVFVPRRAIAGGAYDPASSTYALRSSFFLGDLDAVLMVAKDHGDILANASLSGPLGGAAWNAEVGRWFLADGNAVTSIVANISNSTTLWDHPVNYYAEYYHNGFGVDGPAPMDTLPPALSKRLATGQVFTIGRDMLALGGQVGVTPDISLIPSVIGSLNDGSYLLAVQGSWSINDESSLTLSASKSFGQVGSEFGGRETSTGSGVYLRAPTNVAVKFTRYF